MKKIILSFLVFGAVVSLAACNSSENKMEDSSTTVSLETVTEDTSIEVETEKEDEMKKLEDSLGEESVEVIYDRGELTFTREKGVDCEYFKMTFLFSDSPLEIFDIELQLKGNIDGEKKDLLHFNVSNGRIVEKEYRATDIVALAEVLESIEYSDKELVEFAWWYFENNK
ncbi:hypothetical protein IW492_01860 [Enterococcus sp. BWB1-3]|uniref:hypothetical protein n=1 Tax=Enterococcus sp. BWB1-3 TaxID=2787713 RepID=UPI001924767E|nr:hypothetical protein [Enterococcus sp. BWB1-3]MBL1227974.1 hypothetical protein [Enterococcus sp. BWB1-3]